MLNHRIPQLLCIATLFLLIGGVGSIWLQRVGFSICAILALSGIIVTGALVVLGLPLVAVRILRNRAGQQGISEEQLLQSKERFRSLFEFNPDPVFALDRAGRFVSANPACGSLSGFPVEKLLLQPFAPLIDPAHLEYTQERFEAALAGVPQTYNTVIRDKDGRRIDLSVTNLPIMVDGTIVGVYGIAKDITARTRAERGLKHIVQGVSASTGDAFFTSLVQNLAEALEVDFVLVGQLVDSNRVRTIAVHSWGEIAPNFTYELAHTPCEHVRDNRMCCYPQGAQAAFPLDKHLAELGLDSYAGAALIDSSGRITGILAVLSGRPFPDSNFVQSMLQIFATRAASELERKTAEEQLAFLAYHDAHTRLPNRSAFLSHARVQLARANENSGSLALLYLDLDNFKDINDTLGHQDGDELLLSVSYRLKLCAGEQAMVARLSGDEFAILVGPFLHPTCAVDVAERIASAMNAPFYLSGRELFATFSIGIALSSERHQDPVDLLRDADIAMYHAKRQGKAHYAVFDPSMNAAALQRLELIQDLRWALQRREFLLFYQPIIDLCSGKAAGVEALVRWNHPKRGLVSPGEFIPLAEESGLIVALDQWVLQEACRQASEWRQMGHNLYVNVNLSARYFLRPSLLTEVEECLLQHGLSAGNLHLEITESVMLQDDDATMTNLRRLASMGVRMAIDDFGTGYSSLSYLQRLPVQIIKLDRGFVRGVASDLANRRLVSAIIQVCKALGLTVTAEGVETEEQQVTLASLGCDNGQGFLFARPMPPEELARWIAAEK